MSSSAIPDGFSMDDLKSMMESAPQEKEVRKPEGPFNGYTEENIREVAADLCQAAIEQVGHPMVHKAMLLFLLESMLEWHSRVGAETAEEGGEGSTAMGWLRDAGKFQAMCNILSTVSVCGNDFLMGDDC